MLDVFKLFFNSDYRAQVFGLAVERGLPALLAIFIIIVGIAFILSGTKTVETTKDIVETVAKIGSKV